MDTNQTLPKKPSLPSVFERAAAEGTETWVKVWITEKANRKKNDALKIFRAAAIEEITALPGKEDLSYLRLYNGKEVPVKMDADNLWKKIYQPDFRSAGEPINLLNVTGAQAFPAPLTPEIGEMVEGEGVYIGQHTRLSKTFNVFAAPKDLPEHKGYQDTVEAVAALESWHGHSGAQYASDVQINSALEKGLYSGKWIIPPVDILNKNIRENIGKGALKGIFTDTDYYSSTIMTGAKDSFRTVNLKTGHQDYFYTTHKACRPVRLVEVTP